MMWVAVLVAAAGCYLLKLAGLSVPPRVLERPVVERIADLIPVALLSALVAVQVVAQGHHLVLDARAVGLAAAVVLLLLRAPFLVVVFGAAIVAAFAIFHGYAHGAEAPEIGWIGYAVGFVVATALLHAIGIGIGRLLERGAGLVPVRAIGGVTAILGLFLLVK